MDIELTKNEALVLTLLETKDFQELSQEEKNTVLSIMTESDYELRRLLLQESKEIEGQELTPLPLVIPQEESKGMYVPLYQLVSTAAAAILLTLLLIPPGNSLGNAPTIYATEMDTVYIDQVIHDTIVSVDTQVKYVDRIIEVPANATVVSEATRANFATSSESIDFLDINEKQVVNNGESMVEDETYQLVQSLSIPN